MNADFDEVDIDVLKEVVRTFEEPRRAFRLARIVAAGLVGIAITLVIIGVRFIPGEWEIFFFFPGGFLAGYSFHVWIAAKTVPTLVMFAELKKDRVCHVLGREPMVSKEWEDGGWN